MRLRVAEFVKIAITLWLNSDTRIQTASCQVTKFRQYYTKPSVQLLYFLLIPTPRRSVQKSFVNDWTDQQRLASRTVCPAALAACKHLRLALTKDICDLMDVRFLNQPKKQTYFLHYISLNKLKMPNTEIYIIHICAESRTGSGRLRVLLCFNLILAKEFWTTRKSVCFSSLIWDPAQRCVTLKIVVASRLV